MGLNSILERQLRELESDLIMLLERSILSCIDVGTLLFFNSEYLPSAYREQWLPDESEKLLALAKQSIELRSRLGLEIEGTVGQLFLSACTEASNCDNPQRRGPRKLASWLRTEIQLLKMNDRDPGTRH